MTFTEKKIEEFSSKLIAVVQNSVSCDTIYQGDLDDLKEWFKQTIAEAERREVMKSIIEKCKEIDKIIFKEQSSHWKDRGLYSPEAKYTSSAVNEIKDFCQQKLKELEQEK